MNLLHLDSSILGDASASRELTKTIVQRLKAEEPALRVTYRDLAADPLPHYSAASLTGQAPEAAARDTAALEEFLAADVIVIGVSFSGGVKSVQDRRITMSPKLVRAWTSRTSSVGSGLSAVSMELRTAPKRV